VYINAANNSLTGTINDALSKLTGLGWVPPHAVV
jgi:hypothetical protein